MCVIRYRVESITATGSDVFGFRIAKQEAPRRAAAEGCTDSKIEDETRRMRMRMRMRKRIDKVAEDG